jgi:hypothetical protein
MSDGFEKYAVYWVPKRTDALARFGAAWTGWCADQGERRSASPLGDLSINIGAVTNGVRRHGFHAVIKAPFSLAAGRSRFSVEHFLGCLAEDAVSFQLPRLRLAVVDGYVALVPSQASQALDELVSRVGEAFAPLEAATPINGSDKTPDVANAPCATGRKMSGPVLMFPTSAVHRFHLPLTDRLNTATALELIEKLQQVLEPMLREPRQIRDLALMGDPGENRPLRLLLRYELLDWPMRHGSTAMPAQGSSGLAPDFSDPAMLSDIAV